MEQDEKGLFLLVSFWDEYVGDTRCPSLSKSIEQAQAAADTGRACYISRVVGLDDDTNEDVGVELVGRVVQNTQEFERWKGGVSTYNEPDWMLADMVTNIKLGEFVDYARNNPLVRMTQTLGSVGGFKALVRQAIERETSVVLPLDKPAPDAPVRTGIPAADALIESALQDGRSIQVVRDGMVVKYNPDGTTEEFPYEYEEGDPIFEGEPDKNPTVRKDGPDIDYVEL